MTYTDVYPLYIWNFFDYNLLSPWERGIGLKGGYGTDFDFRNIRTPLATTRAFFNQIHQTKFYTVF